jgi:hypothetical protein
MHMHILRKSFINNNKFLIFYTFPIVTLHHTMHISSYSLERTDRDLQSDKLQKYMFKVSSITSIQQQCMDQFTNSLID